MVHFVGAGPGAPDLITVRGKKLIEEADVIIYAGSLVNPQLLAYAGPSCEIHNSAYMTLEETTAVIRKAESEGKMTVRLHTGDPSIYGAIAEQMHELDLQGIRYDVCPGVSSFVAAAAVMNQEYTKPGISQSVIITRAAGRTPVPEAESIGSFAAHQATMVLFLSAGKWMECREQLLTGYAEDTPAAIVYKATWEDERIIRCTVGSLAEAGEASGITGTALIMVGAVLGEEAPKSKLYDAGFETGFRKAHAGKDQR